MRVNLEADVLARYVRQALLQALASGWRVRAETATAAGGGPTERPCGRTGSWTDGAAIVADGAVADGESPRRSR